VVGYLRGSVCHIVCSGTTGDNSKAIFTKLYTQVGTVLISFWKK